MYKKQTNKKRSETQVPFHTKYTTTISCLTLFMEVAFSEYVRMQELLSHVNAVHPWITMPHSPQHLLKMFTYNLTSRFTTTASLSLMPACSFLQMTCSPQICSSAVCLMCRSVSIFRIERKLSSSIILHLILSGFLPDFTHLFSFIPCLSVFMWGL